MEQKRGRENVKMRDEREIEDEIRGASAQVRGLKEKDGERRRAKENEMERLVWLAKQKRLSVSIKDLLCQISMRRLL